MNKLIIKLLKPKSLLASIVVRTPRLWSDSFFLKMQYYLALGKNLDLKDPQTYNEKLQWLKIHDRNPNYTMMVDKVAVKSWVASKIGEQHIIPTLAVWEKAEDVDFNILPNQFVIKCNHNSGGLYVCTDKAKMDVEFVRKGLKESLKVDYYLEKGREWPYKNVQRRILAEKYMVDESGYELKDYKFFCFNGEPKFMFIATDRGSEREETKFDLFDMNFNHMPLTNGHPNATKHINKPKSFEKMKELAKILSEGIPHVRVDFYDINGNIYFGEMTFFHWGGLVPFNPEEYDLRFGQLIKLPFPIC